MAKTLITPLMLVLLSTVYGCSSADYYRISNICEKESKTAVPPRLEEKIVEGTKTIKVLDDIDCDYYGNCRKIYKSERIPYTRKITIDLNEDKRKQWVSECIPKRCENVVGNTDCDPDKSDNPQLRMSALSLLGARGDEKHPDDESLDFSAGKPLSGEQFSALTQGDKNEYLFEATDEGMVSYPLFYAYGFFDRPINPLTGNTESFFWFNHPRLGVCSAVGLKDTPDRLGCGLKWQCEKAGIGRVDGACRLEDEVDLKRQIVYENLTFETGDKMSFTAVHHQ